MRDQQNKFYQQARKELSTVEQRQRSAEARRLGYLESAKVKTQKKNQSICQVSAKKDDKESKTWQDQFEINIKNRVAIEKKKNEVIKERRANYETIKIVSQKRIQDA